MSKFKKLFEKESFPDPLPQTGAPKIPAPKRISARAYTITLPEEERYQSYRSILIDPETYALVGSKLGQGSDEKARQAISSLVKKLLLDWLRKS